jgi:hypothetical protein
MVQYNDGHETHMISGAIATQIAQAYAGDLEGAKALRDRLAARHHEAAEALRHVEAAIARREQALPAAD